MYAGVVAFRVRPGKTDEGVEAYREAVARFADLLAEPPERKLYNVGIRE